MNVIHITSTSDFGGTEQMVLQTVANASCDIYPTVLSLAGSGCLTRACELVGVRAETLSAKHPLDVRAWRRIANIISNTPADVVHLYGLRVNVPGRVIAKMVRPTCRVVAAIHSTDPWRRRRHVWLDRLTARWVDAWISNSYAGMRASIRREKVPPSKVWVAQSAVPAMPDADKIPFTKWAARARLSIPIGATVISFVANLGPEKRHRDLIDAIAMRHKGADLVCLCAGRDQMDGWNQAYAEQQGVGDHFRWLGFLDTEGVKQVIAAADFGVLVSSHEGFGISLLETMAMGRTVIATSVGDIPEFVRPEITGLLLPPYRPAWIARAIKRLIDYPPIRDRMARQARQMVEKEFSLSRMVEQIEEVYRIC